jgi:hypothetical protein
LEPAYEARLKDWGLDSSEPIGTAIVVASRAMLPRLFRSHCDSDYYISNADWELLQREVPIGLTHETIQASNDRKFLLARHPSPGMIANSKQLPAGW